MDGAALLEPEGPIEAARVGGSGAGVSLSFGGVVALSNVSITVASWQAPVPRSRSTISTAIGATPVLIPCTIRCVGKGRC